MPSCSPDTDEVATTCVGCTCCPNVERAAVLPWGSRQHHSQQVLTMVLCFCVHFAAPALRGKRRAFARDAERQKLLNSPLSDEPMDMSVSRV